MDDIVSIIFILIVYSFLNNYIRYYVVIKLILKGKVFGQLLSKDT